MLVVKALLPSFVLTLVVSAVVAASGASAAFLNIQILTFQDHAIPWSWSLFLASSALCWVLLLLID